MFQGLLPYKIREIKQMKEPHMGYELQNTNVKHDFNLFVSFSAFSFSAFAYMQQFPSYECTHVRVHKCIFLVSNTWKDVPDDLHKVVFYHCTEVKVVVSLPTLRLLLLLTPLGGNVAIHCASKKQRARLARLLSQVRAHLHSTLYCVTTSPRATAGY